MKKNVTIRKTSLNNLRVTPIFIDGLEGFEKLFQFVQDNYNVEIIKKVEGPDVIQWTLQCKGQVFYLIYDDVAGNYFEARTQDSEEILYEIGKDLEIELSKST